MGNSGAKIGGLGAKISSTGAKIGALKPRLVVLWPRLRPLGQIYLKAEIGGFWPKIGAFGAMFGGSRAKIGGSGAMIWGLCGQEWGIWSQNCASKTKNGGCGANIGSRLVALGSRFGAMRKKLEALGQWLLRGANSHNTISSYYIPFQDNLGIIFPKFEVPSINDGSHRGKWILANPFIMAKFQSKKLSVLTPDLNRPWKSTIWKYLSFLKIPSGSASKVHLKT